MSQSGTSDRVLIIDDDGGVRACLSACLSGSGLTPVEAPDGETALALLAQSRFNLLLLDIQLPGMDGYQVLRRVKTQTPGLPVVMLTGGGSIPSAVQAVKDGADDYVEKPFAPDALLQTIHRCLAAARSRETGHASMQKPGTWPPVAKVLELSPKAASDSAPHSAAVELRTSERHRFPSGRICRFVTWPDCRGRQAILYDISAAGISLILEEPLEAARDIIIRIPATGIFRGCSLSGRVVHLMALSDGRWRIGCALWRSLSEAEMADLLNPDKFRAMSPVTRA
jgi:CheY-like chemotaxis protein